MGGEEELLVGIEAHRLGDDAKLHGFQVLRTFRDNHDVGTVLAHNRFSESSCRQQLVIDNQAVVVDEQDVDARFHIAVLEGIVEEDDIDVLPLVSFSMPRVRFLSTATGISGNFVFIWYGSSPMVRTVASSPANTKPLVLRL